jgi:glutaredoxin
MKKLLLIAFVAFVFYKAWQAFTPPSMGLPLLYDKPYIAIYGRDTCGWTQKLKKELNQQGISFEYKIVDQPSVGNELHPRMQQAGLSTSYYNLPVVDVNGRIFIRPSLERVLEAYNRQTGSAE